MPSNSGHLKRIATDIATVKTDIATIKGAQATEITGFWTDTSLLVATSGVIASGFAFLPTKNKIYVAKTSTGGTYVFEIDWSIDGSTVLMTETVAITTAPVLKDVMTPHARFRVKNTGGSDFSAHTTWVGYR